MAAAAPDGGKPPERPKKWAEPMKLKGVPNLHKISDGLYRSAQPTAEGMENLRKLGIETIINLRAFHSDRDEIGETGLAYEHIHMKTWHPEETDVVRFLQIVTNPRRHPVLFHCQHGADRTGTMCALYRVLVQGWTKEEALKEMREGGYHFHSVFVNLPRFIEKLDLDSIRKRAGLPVPESKTSEP
jgi:protein tyrosine/serine phosphatase